MYNAREITSDKPEEVARQVSAELKKIQEEASLPAPAIGVQLPVLHIAPTKLREGLLVLADGTDWNPGSGAGYYLYLNGAWRFLGGSIAAIAANLVYAGPAGGGPAAPTFRALTLADLPYPLLTSLSNSIGADVALNNTANYFTGPTIAQGAAGTWFASGCVSVTDTVGATFHVKLWDGTTIIASAIMSSSVANEPQAIALSGVLATPAGNIRMSVRDLSSVNGKILFNTTTNNKDSTLTVLRIA